MCMYQNKQGRAFIIQLGYRKKITTKLSTWREIRMSKLGKKNRISKDQLYPCVPITLQDIWEMTIEVIISLNGKCKNDEH